MKLDSKQIEMIAEMGYEAARVYATHNADYSYKPWNQTSAENQSRAKLWVQDIVRAELAPSFKSSIEVKRFVLFKAVVNVAIERLL